METQYELEQERDITQELRELGLTERYLIIEEKVERRYLDDGTWFTYNQWREQ